MDNVFQKFNKEFSRIKGDDTGVSLITFRRFLDINPLFAQFVVSSNNDITSRELKDLLILLYVLIVNHYVENEGFMLKEYEEDFLIKSVENNGFLNSLFRTEEKDQIMESVISNYPDSQVLLFCIGKILKIQDRLGKSEVFTAFIHVKSWVDNFALNKGEVVKYMEIN